MIKFAGKNIVRMKGLEPPRLSAPDPKSGSATNYDTSAFFQTANLHKFYKSTNTFEKY